MRQSSSSSNLMFDYFAPIFIRARIFIRASIFSRANFYLLDSHLTKVKESRTPIYVKHHLAQKRISWADLSRTPIYEIWSDSNLGRKSNCGLILRTPIYNLSNFNSNFQFQFSIPIFNFNFILPIFQPPFFQPNHDSLAPRT
jgi:hypothetical protein